MAVPDPVVADAEIGGKRVSADSLGTSVEVIEKDTLAVDVGSSEEGV